MYTMSINWDELIQRMLDWSVSKHRWMRSVKDSIYFQVSMDCAAWMLHSTCVHSHLFLLRKVVHSASLPSNPLLCYDESPHLSHHETKYVTDGSNCSAVFFNPLNSPSSRPRHSSLRSMFTVEPLVLVALTKWWVCIGEEEICVGSTGSFWQSA